MQTSETPTRKGGFLAPEPHRYVALATWLSLGMGFKKVKVNYFSSFAVCYQNIANRAKGFQLDRFLVAVTLEPGGA